MYIEKHLGIVLSPTHGSWDAHSTAAPIVWKEQDQYYMLYQGWQRPEDGNWRTAPGRLLGLATSEDGIHWDKYDGNPVMVGDPDSWDVHGFEAGCLVKVGDQYHLYYTGARDGTLRIGLSVSRDLKTWEKHDGNPILDVGRPDAFDAGGVAFPAVLKERDGWKMIYGGYGPSEESFEVGRCQFGLAVSSDGVTWQKHPHNPVHRMRTWEHFDAHMEVHQTFAIGDYYACIHEAYGRGGRINIGVIYSPDLEVWARCPENPLFPMADPLVRQERSVCHPYLLLDDLTLYHVEVPKPCVLPQHVVSAATIRPEPLNMYRQKSLNFPLWVNRAMGPRGETSSEIPCEAFTRKTFHLMSDQDCAVKIEFDPAGFGRWETLRECHVKSGQVWTEMVAEGLCRTRISCTPVAQATVSAHLLLEA